MKNKLILPVAVLTLLAAACAPVAAPSSGGTSAMPVTITVETNPDPAMMGEVEMVFTILDDRGQPLTGAEVFLFADHTDMTGMTMEGQATEQGEGRYAIRANFSMSGNWTLTVQVKKDGLDYSQDIHLGIQ